MPLLDIRNLTIEFMTPDGPVKAVDRVSITSNEGGERRPCWRIRIQVKPNCKKSDLWR